jgi:homoserine dehydrogenase
MSNPEAPATRFRSARDHRPAIPVKGTDELMSRPVRPGVSVAIVGTGTVGGDLLDLIAARAPAGLCLTALADSRRMLLGSPCLPATAWRAGLAASPLVTDLCALARHAAAGAPAVLVDVTASREVARLHAHWLDLGLDVVTANKWAAAADGPDYRELLASLGRERARYRHSTTVGAGLPVLQTLADLRGAGERVLSVRGLFSGTLGYLTQGAEGGRRFSACLREACRLGITEPDPRLDLAGADVARKLVITARAAGIPLEFDEVAIESLVSPDLEACPLEDFLAAETMLDETWHRAFAAAAGEGPVPRYVGEIDCHGKARVGLQRLPVDHAFARVCATDNVFEIRTESFRDQPIIIRGPGAGAGITAVRVLADLMISINTLLDKSPRLTQCE